MAAYDRPEGVRYAWNQALITDMVLTQPVVYEFPLLRMPTLLFVEDKDNTAIGKAWSPPAVQAVLGHYNVLGKEVIKTIANGTLTSIRTWAMHRCWRSRFCSTRTCLPGWEDRCPYSYMIYKVEIIGISAC